jgi:hypothetical protein
MNIPPAVVWKFTRASYALKYVALPSALRASGLAATIRRTDPVGSGLDQ